MFRITEDPSSGRFVHCLAKITKIFLSSPLTWNGPGRTIFIILAKHCTKLPNDGSSVIRNMSEHFKNILVILIVPTNYILVHQLDNKVFECTREV